MLQPGEQTYQWHHPCAPPQCLNIKALRYTSESNQVRLKVYYNSVYFLKTNTELMFQTWYYKQEIPWIQLCLIYWKSIVNHELTPTDGSTTTVRDSLVNQ